MTAKEVMDRLAADKEYQAAMKGRREEDEKKRMVWRKAEEPILAALSHANVEVPSVWDLVDSTDGYTAAIPVLIEHLHRNYPDRVREGLARALAVPGAIAVWGQLKRLYEVEPDDTDAKAGLAVALSASATSERLVDVLNLLRDERHGSSRILLLDALRRMRQANERAREALHDFVADPVLGEQAARALKGKAT